MGAYFLGIDIGGTKTEVCLLELQDEKNFESYQILSRERIETRNFEPLEAFLPRLQEQVETTLASHSLKVAQLSGIGMGIPGSIDPKKQVMLQGNLGFLKDVPLPETFKKLFSWSGEIIFDNDANCFVLAEAYLGTGLKWAKAHGVKLDDLSIVGITLGTGVGGGLFIDGKILRGRRGGAGEIGHMTLIESGRPCYCGKAGCAEQYLSGAGLEASYVERTRGKDLKSAPEIFKLASANDPHAILAVESYRDSLILFLSNLSNILDPHLIVLGGGLSSQTSLYDGIESRLSSSCFLSLDPPSVLKNGAGDSSGVLGAALLSFAKGIR